MIREYTLSTAATVEFLNITSWVMREVQQSGVQEGACIVYVPHTTAGVTVNESADPSVVTDILMQTGKMVPLQAGYRHMEGNSAAHIKASLFGSSVTVIISRGTLLLGTWQGIFFCEFDGPRSRKVMLKIMRDGMA